MEDKKRLTSMRNFIVVSFVLGLFYYIVFYRELVLNEFKTEIFFRALDGAIFYALGYTWLKVLDEIIGSKDSRMSFLRRQMPKVLFSLMAISALAYVFVLDDYYSATFFWGEITVIALEIVMGLTVIVFTAAYLLIGYAEISDKITKFYIIAASIFINFCNIWNNTIVISVYIKALPVSVWSSMLYGVTSFILLVVYLLTLLYLYMKKFAPDYLYKSLEDERISDHESALMLAEKNKLTEREIEVMLLAYDGLSNPDIADKLYISRHTVKHHLHNIYSKLYVASRIELVRLINENRDL